MTRRFRCQRRTGGTTASDGSAGRGEFVVSVLIGKDGIPTEVRAKTKAPNTDAALVECAVEAFRKMTFQGRARVDYPMRL